ncbi:3-phosphoshikimate 1-carboxyvinyltransferase [Picrophilus oshimae]|uniref:3-phosphoshikimate 1-carboxyvinyltransferase n=1 Tax=Picrophilus torridus (strain ATCC 700027 / DSM 9790 / JCM 10055 / NBRC 100828 / KAW 2/3) TaxID=1122961 RepID=AROA_PICTO|nr:3-phosphoshikimate 1-carboxyvinyltransferase [Picrophilus oshimae]Q6L1G5.1 RecName: Full=3-phosphoshikimate 1-carboxyvinyltransferase; AltName: Full=5-enolpyruvylshikimate-3-phosphate synthase; Short=EPSP synthase; Short=EPSPS [Picrophilus oshimae DSM 9789]AAT43187.1 3-phosphoshikimate 1-carboxyvinyltransferase [Picrophilus oshimae DSM 9789]
MNVRISGEFRPGVINAPSSKSFSQRYILYSAFSNIPVTLKNVSFSDDERIALEIARACGADIEFNDSLTIKPDFRCPDEINAGESGTSLRLATGLLAARRCKTFIHEEASLLKRPLDDLIKTLSEKNVVFNNLDNGIMIDASNSIPSDSIIDGGRSSQFVSSMMMYHSLTSGSLKALNIVSNDYIKITIKTLNDFGISVYSSNGFFEFGKTLMKGNKICIEGDYSSAAFWIVLGLFKGDIEIKNLKSDSCQPDAAIINIINGISERKIDIYNNKIVVHKTRFLGDLYIDVDKNPDLAPPLSIIGIFSDVAVHILNYRRLEIKESNREENIISMARSFGALIEKNDNEMVIRRGKISLPERISFSDHRMIMSSIIAGLISSGDILYENIENINKSYPGFLNDLSNLGYYILK